LPALRTRRVRASSDRSTMSSLARERAIHAASPSLSVGRRARPRSWKTAPP
jgi:hypothetical protein